MLPNVHLGAIFIEFSESFCDFQNKGRVAYHNTAPCIISSFAAKSNVNSIKVSSIAIV